MKVPKHIDKLIEKRIQCGELLNSLDAAINKFMEENDIDFTKQKNDFGCMITTEPRAYAKLTKEAIVDKVVE